MDIKDNERRILWQDLIDAIITGAGGSVGLDYAAKYGNKLSTQEAEHKTK